MVERLSAAICGAGMALLCSSVAMARSEIRGIQSVNGISIVGAASMYNPYRPGYREGGVETASGEPYNPSAWAAAIQADLREKFGGSVVATGLAMPSLRVSIRRSSSK